MSEEHNRAPIDEGRPRPGRGRDIAVVLASLSADGAVPPDLTPTGCDAVERLVSARRERLQEIFEGWSPEMRAQLESVVGRLTRDLVTDARHHVD